MRCKACNTNLSDYESGLKDKESGEHVDLCGTCLAASDALRYEDAYKWDTLANYSENLSDL